MQHAEAPFAALFDMDGVLINTEPAHEAIHKELAKRHGYSEADMQQALKAGTSMPDFFRQMQKVHRFSVTMDQFADELYSILFAHLEETIHGADPSLVRLLDDLDAHNIPSAVGTSALRRSAERKLGILGIRDRFEVVTTANDVSRHKPHPDIYLVTAGRLGMDPKRCIVFEDSEKGIAAGHAAGMKVVGYAKYVADREMLRSADLIIDDFSQVSVKTLPTLLDASKK